MALALESIGWGTADHWMRMQAAYELAQARRRRTTRSRRPVAKRQSMRIRESRMRSVRHSMR